MKNTHANLFQEREMNLRTSNIFPQTQTEVRVIIFTKLNNKTQKISNSPKITIGNRLAKRLLVTVSLPPLQNQAPFRPHKQF